jgi:phage regulator Rha-like protein
MSDTSLSKIENMIYVIRGHKVMLDSDLAELYGVLTKNLNKAVKRNVERFPEDLMFQLSAQEFELLKSQNGSSKEGYGGRRYLPLAFTEGGVAMLSSVLTSDRAAQVNLAIIRTFIKLRSFLAIEHTSLDKVDELGQGTYRLFKIVFERLDSLEEIIVPKLDSERRGIGLKNK